MSRPTCSNRGCNAPATAVYVSTRNVRVPEVHYPRCDDHPLGTAVRVDPLPDAPPQQDAEPVEGALPDIDGNGRDLIRTTLRGGITHDAEHRANWLADDLREHIVSPGTQADPVEGELRPACYLRPDDRARLKCGEAATVYPVSGITGRPGDATIPLFHPHEVDRLRARVQPRRVSTYEVASIIADGYALSYEWETIAEAVIRAVRTGAGNPFEDERATMGLESDEDDGRP